MTNATWVCFDCRQAVRAPTTPRRDVVCPRCRRSTFCPGRRVAIPPKAKVAAWRKLQKDVRSLVAQWSDYRERRRVADRHNLEKQIRRLERGSTTAFVADEIKRLRMELAGG